MFHLFCLFRPRAIRWGICLAVVSLILIGRSSAEVVVPGVSLQLSQAGGSSNRLQLNLDAGPLGSDSAISDLTGDLTADLGFLEIPGGGHSVSEITITGGLVAASDVTFSFLGGLVTAQGTGLAGIPSTTAPPGPVAGNQFDAAEHQLLLNQGTVTAAGSTAFDFSANPIIAPGTGLGMVNLTQLPPEPGFTIYEVSITLPVAADETFQIPNVPIFGTVDARLIVSGNIVSLGNVRVPRFGDYDRDGAFGCTDIDLLTDAIRTGSQDLQFDVDGDGSVTALDRTAWATQIVGTTAGDVNLDLQTDITDFDIWNGNRFSAASGWCQGELNGDGAVDVSDFHRWNANRGTAMVAIPEPASATLLMCLLMLISCYHQGPARRG